MKRALVALTLLTSVVAFGQGSVTFSNSGMVGGGLILPRTGALIPIGSAFQVALYWADKGTPDASFDQAAQQLGAAANFGPTAGNFSGGGRTITSLAPGDTAKFQIRVWETAYGNSYEAVRASGNPCAYIGKSNPFLVDTANPLIGEPNVSIGTLIPRFTVGPPEEYPLCVPEPSAILLGLFAGGFLLFCRLKIP